MKTGVKKYKAAPELTKHLPDLYCIFFFTVFSQLLKIPSSLCFLDLRAVTDLLDHPSGYSPLGLLAELTQSLHLLQTLFFKHHSGHSTYTAPCLPYSQPLLCCNSNSLSHPSFFTILSFHSPLHFSPSLHSYLRYKEKIIIKKKMNIAERKKCKYHDCLDEAT